MADKTNGTPSKAAAVVDEKELDDLLDSALDDFATMKVDGSSKGSETQSVPSSQSNATSEWEDPLSNIGDESKEFEARMAELFSSGNDNPEFNEQLKLGLQKIAEASKTLMAQGTPPPTSEADEFAKKITETLKEFRDGSPSVEPTLGTADWNNIFGNITNQGSGEEDSNPFLPLVQGMLQSLLSAEILLPSIKDILEKYPKYFEEKGDTIDAKDKERYLKQQELFQVISAELEKESPTDTSDVTEKRFKTLLEHLNKLHTYGQPPVELLGENGFDFGLMGGGDVPGMLGMPGMPPSNSQPDQCSLM